jgi:hypothetical protein
VVLQAIVWTLQLPAAAAAAAGVLRHAVLVLRVQWAAGPLPLLLCCC